MENRNRQVDSSEKKNNIRALVGVISSFLLTGVTYMDKKLGIGIMVIVTIIQLIICIFLWTIRNKLAIIIVGIMVIVFSGILIYRLSDNKTVSQQNDIKTGILQINLEQNILQYSALEKITENISKEQIESAKCESYDNDRIIEEYNIDNNTLVFNDVSEGKCKITIKLEGNNIFTKEFNLEEKDKNGGVWVEQLDITLNDNEYKEFSISLKDVNSEVLSNCKCDIIVDGNNQIIQNIESDEFGMLPNSFKCKLGRTLKIRVYVDDLIGEKKINVDDVDDVAEIIFDEIKVTEEVSTGDSGEEINNTTTNYSLKDDIINPRTRLESAEKINTNLYDSANIDKKITDRLTEENREKTYEFSLEKNGPIWVEFNHDNLTDDCRGWKVTIIDKEGVECLVFDVYWNKEKTVSQTVGLKQGKYYVKVEDGGNFTNVNYIINIKSTPMNNYGCESNDTILDKTEILELQEDKIINYYGNIVDYDDVDYYSFTLDEDSVISIKFEHINLTEDTNGWEIILMDNNSVTLASRQSKWTDTSVVLPNVGLHKGTYYIQIKCNGNLNVAIYSLSICLERIRCWEKEINDEINEDNVITIGECMYGSISDYDDEDYYVVHCEETGDYKLLFRHENFTDESNGWSCDVLDENSNSILEDRIYSRHCDTYVECTPQRMESGKTYYIKIQAENLNDKDYDLVLDKVG